MMFYLLSLLTGVLEIGWIFFGVTRSFPMWKILCYPLAYHVGNLFPKPFSLSCKLLRIICCVSAIIGLVTFAEHVSEENVFVLTCCALFMLSAIIQSVRSELKNDDNRLLKRVFRVSGFALAPLAALFPSEILVFSTIIAYVSLHEYKGKKGIIHMAGQKGFSFVMIFHQLHYFFYAHITLAMVSQLLFHDNTAGIMYATLLFCGTWVTYLSVEPLLSKLTDKILPVFYIGHISITILLFSLHLTTSMPLFIMLWLLTGFGGGVVYTISARAKNTGNYQKESMTIAENIGHMLGLLTAVGIATIFGKDSPQIMLMLGSISALLTIISMAFISRKEIFNENIYSKS